MATILCSAWWGSSSCYLPCMNLIRPPSTELLQFLPGYVTLRCDSDLWPFDLGVISRDATWVVNPCTKFEHDRTYSSRVRTTTIFIDRQLKVPIFTFFGGKGNQISNLIFLTPKRHFLGGNDASHTRTVVRECFKGDEASQWKRPKFDPSPHQNPLTDLHQNWQTWLRRGWHPACKIL